ncbi:Uncharacterised protein [Bordetella pertussis]|nr:Uncharacterised protein [Bordetella pertussis]
MHVIPLAMRKGRCAASARHARNRYIVDRTVRGSLTEWLQHCAPSSLRPGPARPAAWRGLDECVYAGGTRCCNEQVVITATGAGARS